MLYVVIGPPAAGKSTWCREQAQPGDIVIDYDRLALALNPDQNPDSHDHPKTIKAVTKAARQAAIDKAMTLAHECDVYLIHSTPSEALLHRYRLAGAQVVTIDPGREIVMQRAKEERPWWMQQAIKKWYDQISPDAPRKPRSTPNQAKPKKTTSERGYGWEHRKQREALKPIIESGKATCWRCLAQGLTPDQARIVPGQPWDLGHDDTDRTKYRGPEHVSCNRGAGGRHRKSSGPPPRSREW